MLVLFTVYAILGALFSALIFFSSGDDDSNIHLVHVHLWIALFWPFFAYVLLRVLLSDPDEEEG
ncbi:MAG: hypothetical protein R6V85_19865, partial [Polyangia bacterium]